MAIKAIRLKDSDVPERTKLYEVGKSRDIEVVETQDDGSFDQVTLEFHVESSDHYVINQGNEGGGLRQIWHLTISINTASGYLQF